MQNKRLKLQKYQLAIQTSLNNAHVLSTTLQHCNESSLMSLLTTPDLSTAYSSDQLTDHQTCPVPGDALQLQQHVTQCSSAQLSVWEDTRRARQAAHWDVFLGIRPAQIILFRKRKRQSCKSAKLIKKQPAEAQAIRGQS